jgi:hypothetical protein
MAFVLADRVQETSTTVGTGSLTLAGAVAGYQSFSAIGNGNNTYYTIALQGGSEWEVGIGTYTSSGTTLSRDTVLASSASGAKVSFSAGIKQVFCDYPAGKAVYREPTNNDVVVPGVVTSGNGLIINGTTVSDNATVGTGYNAFSVGPITVASGKTVTVASGQRWLVV